MGEQTFRKWRDERRAEKQKAQDEEEADRKRKGIMTGREIFMQVQPSAGTALSHAPLTSCSPYSTDFMVLPYCTMLPGTAQTGICQCSCASEPTHVLHCAAGSTKMWHLQEGFLAEDDMGAHDAYTREMDEEEAIAAMEVEAAARRAQGATSAAAPPNGHPGGSSSSGDGATHPGARRAPEVAGGSMLSIQWAQKMQVL